MLDQTSQWYKLQYPECFVNEELLEAFRHDYLSDSLDKAHKPLMKPQAISNFTDLVYLSAISSFSQP